MVLVGPSGSGKTTMIKMINRLLEPTDGNIYMDGKRIKDYDERELRLYVPAYVLQAIALFPNLTVAENIALIPEMKAGLKKKSLLRQKNFWIRWGSLLQSMRIACLVNYLVGSNSGLVLCALSLENQKFY